MTDEQTGQRMTDHIARTVAQLREARRLRLTELSDRLSELGQPIPVLGLRRIERGERKMDVDEIVALAKALEVPPLYLMLPVGDAPETEILPGVVRDTWEAAKWFTGEAPLSTEPVYNEQGALEGFTQSSEDFNEWHTGARPLVLVREHERLLMEWRLAVMHTMGNLEALRDAVRLASTYADPAAGEAHVERLRQLTDKVVTEAREKEQALLDHRRHMQRLGMVLPDVPELQPERRRILAEHGLQGPPTPSEDPVGGVRDINPLQLPPVRDPSAPSPGSILTTSGAQLAAETMATIARKFEETGKLPGDRDDADQEGGQ